MAEEKKIKDEEGLEKEIKAEETTSKKKEEKKETPEKKPSSKKTKAKKPAKKKETKEEKLKNEVEEHKAKNAELNDKFIRLYSEFDNFRKRSLKEKDDLRKTASKEVILSLLPVVDDFERAMNSMNENDNTKALIDGVELIYNKFLTALKNRGMEAIEAVGKDFNTDFHEAITQIPAPKKNLKGKVVDEIEKGYLLEGKVIRYSKVVIGK